MSPCFQGLFAVDSYGEYISWTNCSRKVKGINNGRMPRERKPTLFVDSYPDAPCMDYLPTLGEKWPHSRGNGLVNIPYMEHLGYVTLYTKKTGGLIGLQQTIASLNKQTPPKSSGGQITLWEGQSQGFFGYCISFLVIFGWEKKTQFK